jgi:hypothetical protein
MTSPQLPLPAPPPNAHTAIFRAAQPDYVAVYVEGPDDVEMWKPWLRCTPIAVGGRSAVLAAVQAMRAAADPGYVGIIDADCERLDGANPAASDTIVSENHDLECDLLRSPALDRLLSAVDNEQVKQLSPSGLSFRDALIERALPFGLVRWLFFQRRVEYPLRRFSVFHFVSKTTWALDQGALMNVASAVLNEGVSNLSAEISILRSRVSDPWHVCNGHDLIAILAIALQGPLRARHRFPREESVATSLRLAVDSMHLPSMAIWRELKGWESRNTPWCVCLRT